MISLAQGVSVKNASVKITEPIAAFTADLRAKIPSSIPMLITSGYRDPMGQADAMANKVEKGEPLAKAEGGVYANDYAEAVGAAYPNRQRMASVIASFAARGRGSRHLVGQAFDLRSSNLNRNQIDQVLRAAKGLGADQAIYETAADPHIHIEIPVGYKGTSPVKPPLETGRTTLTVRPPQPSTAGKPRDVDGAGGWVYRQWPDGTIKIIGAPAGRSPGGLFAPGSATNVIITNEIGPYVAPTGSGRGWILPVLVGVTLIGGAWVYLRGQGE